MFARRKRPHRRQAAEADDMARTPIRSKMHEPYRTLLGHFRRGIVRPDIRRRGELPQSDVTAGRADRCAQRAEPQQAASQHGHAECVCHSCWRMRFSLNICAGRARAGNFLIRRIDDEDPFDCSNECHSDGRILFCTGSRMFERRGSRRRRRPRRRSSRCGGRGGRLRNRPSSSSEKGQGSKRGGGIGAVTAQGRDVRNRCDPKLKRSQEFLLGATHARLGLLYPFEARLPA